jgi:putative sporulation protein YtaF
LEFFGLLSEAALLVAALSADALASGFAYGGGGIKLPFISALIINLVCGATLAAALFAGAALGAAVPRGAAESLCAGLLFGMGLFKAVKAEVKSVRGGRVRLKSGARTVSAKRGFEFILHLSQSPEDADVNRNKVLSPLEAVALAAALSLDGVTAGIGAGIADGGVAARLAAIALSLTIGMAALYAGAAAGKRLTRKIPFDPALIGGILLMTLGVGKFM